MSAIIACSSCGASNPETARFCGSCGQPLSSQTMAAQPSNKKKSPVNTVLSLIALCTVGGFVVIGCIALFVSGGSSGSTSKDTSEQTVSPTIDGPEIELLASRGHKSSESFWTVEGQVKNVSGRSIDNIVALVTWYDVDDKFITSDHSLIEFRPLLEGQTSPFDVITSHNPAMNKYSIEFQILGGRKLRTRDLRK